MLGKTFGANRHDPLQDGSSDDHTNHRTATVDRIARITIIAAMLYMLLYFPYFFWQCYRISRGVAVSPLAIFPAHLIGMVLNCAALIFTIRDLYLRPSRDPNAKLTWLLLILLTGGIGWIVYVFVYALKPRTKHIAG